MFVVAGSLAEALSQQPPATRSKWKVEVNDFGERIESAKTAVVGLLVTGVAATPVEGLIHLNFLPQWEFNVDQISVVGAAFALVYRYAVREDENPQLKSGVVGAFSLTRALSSVKVSAACSYAPLECGPPFNYLDYDMTWQLISSLASSGIAFTAAAAAVDAACERGWLKRFPSASSPVGEQQ